MPEPILEPDLPIIDPHHHLWDRRTYATPTVTEHPFMTAIQPAQRYLLDELMADTGAGHNVIGTVFLECGAFYKADGPVELRPVGEVEFVNGVAAMSASGMLSTTISALRQSRRKRRIIRPTRNAPSRPSPTTPPTARVT